MMERAKEKGKDMANTAADKVRLRGCCKAQQLIQVLLSCRRVPPWRE